jgi:hypothetical protein
MPQPNCLPAVTSVSRALAPRKGLLIAPRLGTPTKCFHVLLVAAKPSTGRVIGIATRKLIDLSELGYVTMGPYGRIDVLSAMQDDLAPIISNKLIMVGCYVVTRVSVLGLARTAVSFYVKVV